MYYLKIFGIQRTGTNYFEQLKVRNFKKSNYKLVSPLGWKHNFVDVDANKSEKPNKNIKAIFCIKNPYTWYSSIIRWIKMTPHDWPFGDNTPEQVFIRYNNLYANYKEFLLDNIDGTVFGGKSTLVRYEDLLRNPRPELKRIASELDISMVGPFRDVSKVPMSSTFTKKRRDYYLRQYPDYERKLIKRVTEAVDWNLMKFYGYNKLEEI